MHVAGSFALRAACRGHTHRRRPSRARDRYADHPCGSHLSRVIMARPYPATRSAFPHVSLSVNPCVQVSH